jgi:PKD repeat protein
MFTQGQRNRMRAALHSSMAGRNNLITAQNLIATGVNDSTLCKASFSVDHRTVCFNDSVHFSDKSLWYPTSWNWDFGDGTFSTEQHPAHAFAFPGEYYVTLTVTQQSIILKSDSMRILVHGDGAYPFYVQRFDSLQNFEQSDLWNISDNPNLIWQRSATGQGYNSAVSAALRPNDSTDIYSGRTVLYSPTIDLSGRVNPAFNFKYAFTPKVANVNDQLEVFVSNTCGSTWQSIGKKTGANLATIATPIDDKNWTPLDSTQWKTLSYTIQPAMSVVNFQFKIEYTNFRGNVLYIDNINVNAVEYTDVEALHLCEAVLSPNPATNTFSVEGEFDELTMSITDLNGKVVGASQKIEAGEQHDISGLPRGVYIVTLQSNTGVVHKRLMK